MNLLPIAQAIIGTEWNYPTIRYKLTDAALSKDVQVYCVRIPKVLYYNCKNVPLEMRRSAEDNLEKLEHEAAKSKDIAAESRERINDAVREARDQVQDKYRDLKKRITDSIMPS